MKSKAVSELCSLDLRSREYLILLMQFSLSSYSSGTLVFLLNKTCLPSLLDAVKAVILKFDRYYLYSYESMVGRLAAVKRYSRIAQLL